MTVSTYDLTTIDAVRTYMGGASTVPLTADAQLQLLITAYSRACATYCSRDFRLLQRQEMYTGIGSNRLVLNQGPIVSIASVQNGTQPVSASAGVTQTGYVVDPDYTLMLRGNTWYPGLQSVAVDYLAGYLTPGQAYSVSPPTPDLITLPQDLQDSVIEAVALRWRRIPNEDKASLSIAQQTTAFITASLPATTKMIWDAYARGALWP